MMEANETRLSDVELIRQYSETDGYTNGQPTGSRVTEDGSAVLFLRSGPRDNVRTLFEMDARTGEVREVISAAEILGDARERLSPEEKARRERMREGGRGIASFVLFADGRHVLINLGGRLHVVRRADGQVTSLPERDEGPAIDPKFSPDGKYVTCVRGHDLYAIDWEAGEEWAVTTGGSAEVTHGLAEFVAAEEMGRHTGYWWSGDSKLLAFAEADLRDVEALRIADSFHPEQAPQPWRYPRAGTANATVRLGIVSARGGTVTWVDWDRERFPYLATVKWGRTGPLTILVQSRDQQEQVLYRVDPTNGQLTELLRETDPAWLNIHKDMPKWYSDGNRFVWLSGSRGTDAIELRDRDGELLKTLSLGGAGSGGPAWIDGVVAVNDELGGIVVRHGDRPTETSLSAVNLETGAEMPWSSIVDPRPGGSSNAAWTGSVSKNWMTWVLTKSDLAGARTSWVVSKLSQDGAAHELPSVAVKPPYVPNLELTAVEAGGRVFQTAIIRPRAFRKGNKYPVLVRVYGGPGHNTVTADALGQRFHRAQWLADQGFIVVSFDGRGTPRRGHKWERAIRGNFIDAPLSDQVAALQALGGRLLEMDLSRVGIYGWSFGGYFSAMAVMKRPDVFHAAAAGAPVVDWADYDTHYTERYLGLPQEESEAYRVSNVLTYADRLERPLLLIHGTADDNVYFLHSLKLSNALFLAGRPYELAPLCGHTHSPRDPDVVVRIWERIGLFFKKQLQQSTPRRITVSDERDADSAGGDT